MKREELLEIINRCEKTILDVCIPIYDFIYMQSEESQFDYFYTFMDEINKLDLDVEANDPEDIERLFDSEKAEEIFQLKNRILGNNILLYKEKKEFYRELWDKMNDVCLISNENIRKLFFIFLWTDNRIPYYETGEGCSMDDDEFIDRLKGLEQLIKKASFITSTTWEQKTQKASHLMKLAEGIDDERTRTVFWGVVISLIELNAADLSGETKE